MPVQDTADFIAECEEAGLDGVGVHDHQHSARDVFVTLALAAERTSRLRLYPATSNPVTRHPMVLAALAATLGEVAPGRSHLTLAPGFLSVGNIGHRMARIAEMREAVLTIKRLLAGETLPFGYTHSRMRRVALDPTPVYILASGPRMMELAGEVGDGAMVLVGLHPNAVSEARRLLKVGADRAGRDLSDFPVIFIAPMSVDDGDGSARRWPRTWLGPGKPWITEPASNLYWLRQSGIDLPKDVDPDRMSEETAARVCDAWGLYGSPEECALRLERAVDEAGLEHVFLFPSHTIAGGYWFPMREIDAFRRYIKPMLTA
jgi:5,10-methylenetetrahydromethanopterin reductase